MKILGIILMAPAVFTLLSLTIRACICNWDEFKWVIFALAITISFCFGLSFFIEAVCKK